MALRNTAKQQEVDLLFSDQQTLNPFAVEPGAGALENFIPQYKKLTRVTNMPLYNTNQDMSAVWHLVDFRFVRASAPEEQLLIFKADGKVYMRQGGDEHIIFPVNLRETASGSQTSVTTASVSSYAASGATVTSGVGDVQWLNASNAVGAPDGNVTGATGINGNNKPFSDYLLLTGYAPSIPAGATILGIQVNATASATDSPRNNLTATLTMNSTAVSSTKSLSPGPSLALLSYGDSSDLWGFSWTSANIANIGVRFQATPTQPPPTFSSFVDAAQIVIFYTTATSVSQALVVAQPLVKKPVIAQINNRLHVCDGAQYLIWDGWSWQQGGLQRTNGSPSTAFVNSGSLTGTYQIATTWVYTDNLGVRVHESSRSDIVTLTPSSQNIKVSQPSSPPPRATDWSVYMSEVSTSTDLLRVSTAGINVTSQTVSAEPASTAPSVPFRNDPPPMTNVLTQWKYRLAANQTAFPSQMWFSALGEVAAYLNGAPEESWCGLSTNQPANISVSDLVNEWTLPDQGEVFTNAIWHDNFLVMFSNRNGYMLMGDGSLLDNVALRDFYPQKVFNFGAASAFSTVSTPQGLVVLTEDRRLWLWDGKELANIGVGIQSRLSAISSDDLADTQLAYWENNGRTWLLIPLSDRIAVMDFGVRTQDNPRGVWFSIGSLSSIPQVTSLAIYNPGAPILLAGCADGSTLLLDTISQPCILGESAILNQCYLSGGTVLASPTAVARTASIEPVEGKWTDARYIQFYHTGSSDNTATGIRTTDPTVNVYYDGLNPFKPSSPIAQTLYTVPQSKERRAWLATSSTSSAAGGIGRRFQSELIFTTTDTASGLLNNNEVWEYSLAVTPHKELSQ